MEVITPHEVQGAKTYGGAGGDNPLPNFKCNNKVLCLT